MTTQGKWKALKCDKCGELITWGNALDGLVLCFDCYENLKIVTVKSKIK